MSEKFKPVEILYSFLLKYAFIHNWMWFLPAHERSLTFLSLFTLKNYRISRDNGDDILMDFELLTLCFCRKISLFVLALHMYSKNLLKKNIPWLKKISNTLQ